MNTKEIKNHWLSSFLFVFFLWFTSRLLIVISMQLIAPLMVFNPVSFETPSLDTLQVKNFVPYPGWELFTHWDGEHYRNIVTKGYTYGILASKQYNVVFFPLYPLLVKILVSIGIPFDIAGTVLSNIVFLFALWILYRWLETTHSQSIARWTTAVMAWLPMSLFCSLTYTESFFLLFTTLALSSFENHRYYRAALWGMLATATRPPGFVLIPALLLFSWLERRSLAAYLSTVTMSGGILAHSIFCWIQFNQPFAFILAQSGWQQPSWIKIFKDTMIPLIKAQPSLHYSISIAIIAGIIGILMVYFPRWRYSLTGVSIVPFLLHSVSWLQMLTPILSVSLLWSFRHKINRMLLIYGWMLLAFLLWSGARSSTHRYIYTIIPISLALGMLFSKYPESGYVALLSFAALLYWYTIKFAWWEWVG
jgi:Gpi18-like mannosyltransferase